MPNLKSGNLPKWVDLFNGRDLSGWVDVNTSPKTWSVKDGLLVCTGKPIGVMRSERQYENFLLHVEWRHMEAGGNSGIFAWSDAIPFGNRLPKGLEIQMLELDWVKLNTKKGKPHRPLLMCTENFLGPEGSRQFRITLGAVEANPLRIDVRVGENGMCMTLFAWMEWLNFQSTENS